MIDFSFGKRKDFSFNPIITVIPQPLFPQLYTILVRKLEGKSPFGRPRVSSEVVKKVDLKEIGCDFE
jgi:hypothetical protein